MKIVLDMMGSDKGSQATKEGARLFHSRHPEIELILVGKKEELADMVESVFALAGAQVEFSGGYPGWAPDMQSPILQTMKRVYKQRFGQEPKVMIIHAGLECGILGTHYPSMDMISFGPTIRHPHSPDEKVNIESVGKFWEYLLATLAEIPA